MLFRASAMAVLATVLSTAHAAAQDADPRIELVLAQISAKRLATTVEKLASFGTRHTLSSQTDPSRGLGAATQWIHDELRERSRGRPPE